MFIMKNGGVNTRVLGSTIFLVAILFCGFKVLYPTGIVGQTKKPLNAPPFFVKGCFCHSDTASPNVSVWIAGPDTLQAGTRGLYTLYVVKDSNIAAGFDVAAFLGDLGVHDSSDTQLMRIDINNPVDSLELTHMDEKLANGNDTVSWSFWYRAPQVFGIVDTIYANGNSVDTSGDPSGDYWNYAPNFLVNIIEFQPLGVKLGGDVQLPAEFALSQNYPNPFNPVTTIRYNLPIDTRVSLHVFNTLGQEVAMLVNEGQKAGYKSIEWNAGGVASGIYFYRLRTQDFTETKKLLLLR